LQPMTIPATLHRYRCDYSRRAAQQSVTVQD